MAHTRYNRHHQNNTHHQRVNYNTTEHIEESGIISGRRDAAFLRNKYQTELDNANQAIVSMVHYCEDKNKELKASYNQAQGWKATVSAHEKEREQAYSALGNLLDKETNYEKVMHKENIQMYKDVSKNQKSENLKIKQRNTDSENEMNFGSMMKYLDKYPEYQSKSSFKKILDKIDEKEKELRHAKEEYNRSVSAYHEILQSMKIYITKAKDKIQVYNQILKEGQDKINNTRYKKGLIYKFIASEKSKTEINLDTLKHRVPQFENTVKIIEDGLSQFTDKKFTELEY